MELAAAVVVAHRVEVDAAGLGVEPFADEEERAGAVGVVVVDEEEVLAGAAGDRAVACFMAPLAVQALDEDLIAALELRGDGGEGGGEGGAAAGRDHDREGGVQSSSPSSPPSVSGSGSGSGCGWLGVGLVVGQVGPFRWG